MYRRGEPKLYARRNISPDGAIGEDRTAAAHNLDPDSGVRDSLPGTRIPNMPRNPVALLEREIDLGIGR